MKLTPMDINNKEFKKIIRGYNPEEVDEFLDKIVEDYEALYKENANLKEKVAAMNERLEHYSKIEATIQNTLVLAQNAAEQAKGSAKKEAEIIIKNANDTAQKVLDKSHNDVMRINDEYDRVKFRSFMQVQLETFDDLEKDFEKNYSVGTTVEDVVEEKPIENSIEKSPADSSNDDDRFKTDELEAIKNFFIKEKEV